MVKNMNQFERKITKAPAWELTPPVVDRADYEVERNWLWENIFSKIIPGQLYIMRASGVSHKYNYPTAYEVLLRTKNGRETMGNNLLILPIDYCEQWNLQGSMATSGNCLTVLHGDRVLYFRATKKWIEERDLKFIPLTEENAHEVQEPEIT